MENDAGVIRQRIAEYERELHERRASLPQHSLRPHQLLEIERLEESLADLKQQLAVAETHGKKEE
jgi:hypothetical protein